MSAVLFLNTNREAVLFFGGVIAGLVAGTTIGVLVMAALVASSRQNA